MSRISGATLVLLDSLAMTSLPTHGGDDVMLRSDVITGGGGKALTLLGHPVAVGKKAPEFTVLNGRMQPVSLSAYDAAAKLAGELALGT